MKVMEDGDVVTQAIEMDFKCTFTRTLNDACAEGPVWRIDNLSIGGCVFETHDQSSLD